MDSAKVTMDASTLPKRSLIDLLGKKNAEDQESEREKNKKWNDLISKFE